MSLTKQILQNHTAHSTNSQNFDSWHCRTCDKWMRAGEVDDHLVEKLEEAQEARTAALVMYRGAMLGILREVQTEDWGGYVDMQTRLESISNIVEGVFGACPPDQTQR